MAVTQTIAGGLWRTAGLALPLPLGLFLVLVAERVFPLETLGEQSQLVARTVGYGTLLAAAAAAALRGSRATGPARGAELRLAAGALGTFLAGLLYFASTADGHALLGLEAEGTAAGLLEVAWPALGVLALVPWVFMTLAYMAMPIPEAVELRRVDSAAQSGLSLACGMVFVASMAYAADAQPVRRDLSHLRASEPSAMTTEMVRNVEEPVAVTLFYPRPNEVLDQLLPYFEALDAASEGLSVEVRDHALARALAEQHQVANNGYVLLTQGEGESQQARKFLVGTEIEAARTRLRRLDGSFQEAFVGLVSQPRALYFTQGHRERSATGEEGDPAWMRVSNLNEVLRQANVERESLGVNEGLAREVPAAAPAVAVVGPREPFLPEEVDSLIRYVRGGGRLFVLVDPEDDHGLEPLFEALGVSMREGVLHSNTRYRPLTRTDADRSLVYSNAFSAHASVSRGMRYRSQVAAFFYGGGAFDRAEATPDGVQVSFPLRTEATGYWLDLDGDHTRDEDEPSERFQMMAAVTVANPEGEEGRAVLLAEADFVSDLFVGRSGSQGNIFVLADSIQWLVGTEQIVGPTATAEDIEIEHTREGDRLWFYGTSFGAPLPLLLMGVFVGWRRNRRRPSPPEPTAPRPATGEAATPRDEEDAREEEE
jgi:hypothetical protein